MKPYCRNGYRVKKNSGWPKLIFNCLLSFALLRKYGPIPVITEYVPQSTPSSEFGGRCHYDYCVNWIAYQLDLAAQNLPPTREGTEWGRATSTMAKALKARVLMYAASPLWNGQFPFLHGRIK